MPKYKFDFMLNIWLQDVEIEANSYEEAVDILTRMSEEELLDEGYVKDSDITDLDCEEEDDEDDDEFYSTGW